MAEIRKKYFSEEGSITVIAALLMTVFLVISALVVDIGMTYTKISDTQNAADAAVLAAGTLLPVKASDTVAVQKLYDRVKTYAAKNDFLNLSDEDITTVESNGLICRVDIDTKISVPTYFAKVIGVKSLSAPISSAVGAVPTGSMSGLVPIGISSAELDNAIQTGQTEHIILKYGGGDGTNGDFGFIFLDGSVTGGTPNFTEWMSYGYNGTLFVGQELYQRTGNINTAVRDGFLYRYSHCNHWGYGIKCTHYRYVPGCPLVITMLVYDYTGSADITVKGFAPFVLEGYTSDGAIIGSYVNSIYPSSETEGNSFYGSVSISLIK